MVKFIIIFLFPFLLFAKDYEAGTGSGHNFKVNGDLSNDSFIINKDGAVSVGQNPSTPAEAIFYVESSDRSSVPCPRMLQTAIDLLVPEEGFCVWNLDKSSLELYDGSKWGATGGGSLVLGTPTIPLTVPASGLSYAGISNTTIYIQSSGGHVDITGDPQIVNTEGQAIGDILTLIQVSTPNTLKFFNGNGLILNGEYKMERDHVLQFIYTGNLWQEINRADYDSQGTQVHGSILKMKELGTNPVIPDTDYVKMWAQDGKMWFIDSLANLKELTTYIVPDCGIGEVLTSDNLGPVYALRCVSVSSGGGGSGAKEFGRWDGFAGFGSTNLGAMRYTTETANGGVSCFLGDNSLTEGLKLTMGACIVVGTVQVSNSSGSFRAGAVLNPTVGELAGSFDSIPKNKTLCRTEALAINQYNSGCTFNYVAGAGDEIYFMSDTGMVVGDAADVFVTVSAFESGGGSGTVPTLPNNTVALGDGGGSLKATVYTFPQADAVGPGYILSTDGAGVVSWTAPTTATLPDHLGETGKILLSDTVAAEQSRWLALGNDAPWGRPQAVVANATGEAVWDNIFELPISSTDEDILKATGVDGVYEWVNVGTVGQVLTVSPTSEVEWANPTGGINVKIEDTDGDTIVNTETGGAGIDPDEIDFTANSVLTTKMAETLTQSFVPFHMVAGIDSFYFDNDNSNRMTIGAPTDITADYDLKWPADAPAVGEVMVSNALGELSWGTTVGSKIQDLTGDTYIDVDTNNLGTLDTIEAVANSIPAWDVSNTGVTNFSENVTIATTKDLLPVVTETNDIGSAALQMDNIYTKKLFIDGVGELEDNTGNFSITNNALEQIVVQTKDATTTDNSGNVGIVTGDVVDGNAGDIVLTAGAPSGTGNEGAIKISSETFLNRNAYLLATMNLVFEDDTGTSQINLTGPPTLASNYDMIFPATVPIAGEESFIFSTDTGQLTFRAQPFMDWQGEWAVGFYKFNQVVKDGDYTMIVNNPAGTSDRAGPQDLGPAAYIYTGTIGTTNVSAKQLIYGQRYTTTVDSYASGYRVHTVTGNNYNVFLVEDPLGTPVFNQIIKFTATSDGWTEFALNGEILPSGTTFDFVVLETEPDPTPVTFNGNWNYTTPQNIAAPASGTMIHPNGSLSLLNVHKTDDAAADRSAELATLTVGDIIEGPNLRWAIQSITDQGTYITFGVSPQVQEAADGIQNFIFETVVATPLTYGVDVGFNVGPNVSGLFIADGEYASIVLDTNQYGLDLKVTNVSFSPDWDVVAVGKGGGGSGDVSGGPSSVEGTPAVYADASGKQIDNGEVHLMDMDITLANPAHQEGRVFYDNTANALSYYNESSDLTINIGQELVSKIRNTSGAAIANGDVVRITGATGDRPTVSLAQADSEANSTLTACVVTEVTIANNDDGYCATFGIVRDLNLGAFSDGDILYLSDTVAGGYTTTKPNIAIRVGIVLRAHATEGLLQVGIRSEESVGYVENDHPIVADLSSITLKNQPFESIRVEGDGGPVTVDVTSPFGAGPFKSRATITIIGLDDTNTVALTFSDTAGAIILNGPCVLKKDFQVTLQYDEINNRWRELNRNF
jgi:hypothetical protein